MPVKPITIYSSQPSAKREVRIAYVDDAYKKFKKSCDDLRCPLCGAQLDGNIHNKKAELYCVGNDDEYKVTWVPHLDHPYSEKITYWYTQYMYTIHIQYTGGTTFDMYVYRYNMDAHPSQRHKTMVLIFRYSGNRILAFRQRMEEEKFLKKLKTIKVFS
jgi:hypothetical protein